MILNRRTDVMVRTYKVELSDSAITLQFSYKKHEQNIGKHG